MVVQSKKQIYCERKFTRIPPLNRGVRAIYIFTFNASKCLLPNTQNDFVALLKCFSWSFLFCWLDSRTTFRLHVDSPSSCAVTSKWIDVFVSVHDKGVTKLGWSLLANWTWQFCFIIFFLCISVSFREPFLVLLTFPFTQWADSCCCSIYDSSILLLFHLTCGLSWGTRHYRSIVDFCVVLHFIYFCIYRFLLLWGYQHVGAFNDFRRSTRVAFLAFHGWFLFTVTCSVF